MENSHNRFSPGCALMLYKPELAARVHDFLNQSLGNMEMHLTCCRHEPGLHTKTKIINICPGCNKRFKNDYKVTTTVSLWEILSERDDFPFPDYRGKTMTILDACPTRNEPGIHDAIRVLLKKMNIRVIEPEKTRDKGTCCGDTFYGTLPMQEVKERMRLRTNEMPVDDVIVYCVSCVNSILTGGKKPHYLVDLLFNEETLGKTTDPERWHKELDEYIAAH